MAIPQAPNQRWSLDFVSDVLSWGRRFRVLAVVDDFTRRREALALVVDSSLPGGRVAREMDALIARRGRPLMIVSTTAPNSPRALCSTGRTAAASSGTISRPASRSRTPSSRRSTPGSGTNV